MDAAIFVYDVTRKETLDDVKFWATELDENEGPQKRADKIVTCLVANKIDLESQI